MVTADAEVIVGGDASPGIDTRTAAVAGIVGGGIPDSAFGAGAYTEAHGPATKKRPLDVAGFDPTSAWDDDAASSSLDLPSCDSGYHRRRHGGYHCPTIQAE